MDEVELLAQEFERQLEALLDGISNEALGIIAQGLRDARGMTQAEALAQIAMDQQVYRELILRGGESVRVFLQDYARKMATANDKWAERFYRARDMEPGLLAQSEAVNQIINSGVEATAALVGRFTNSKALAVLDRNGNPILWGDYYRERISQAVAAMTTGTQTYEQIVQATVHEMAASGLRTTATTLGDKVIYNSGTTREIYSAVRTNVLDNYRQMTQDMRAAQGAEFGADGFEISAHAPCAPDHLPYQGEVYTMREFQAIQSSLARPISYGANCGHMATPVLVEVARQTKVWDRDELEDMRARSEEPITFIGAGGKELTMSRYEASQYQRQLETSMRKNGTGRALANMAGVDSSRYTANIDRLESAYKRCTKASGLQPQWNRTLPYTIRDIKA